MLKRISIDHTNIFFIIFILMFITTAGCGSGGSSDTASTAGTNTASSKTLEISGSLSEVSTAAPGLGIDRAVFYGADYSVGIVNKDNLNEELGKVTLSAASFSSSIPLSETPKYPMIIIKERSAGRIIFRNLLGRTPLLSELPPPVEKISVKGLKVDENTTALALLIIEKKAVPDIPIVIIPGGEGTFGATITEDHGVKKSLFETTAIVNAGGAGLVSEIAGAVRTIAAIAVSKYIDESVKAVMLEPSSKPGTSASTTDTLKSFLNIIKNSNAAVQKVISDKKLSTTVTLNAETINNQSDPNKIDAAMNSIISGKIDTGLAPVLAPVTIGPAVLRYGDTVSIVFTANKDLYSIPAVKIIGVSAQVKMNGTRSYTASRVIAAGDTNPVTFSIAEYFDNSGNRGAAVTQTTDGSLSFISSEKSTVSPPVITPAAGAYEGTMAVSISSGATDGAIIKYTLDGTDPSGSNGMVYSGILTLTSSAMVKAVAIKSGWQNSPVVSAIYTITSLAPVAAAPVNPVTDDKFNAFDWTNNPLYTAPSNYEFSKNNGVSWTVCTVKPQTGMSGNITAGWVKVRVRAGISGAAYPASQPLSSLAAYTATPSAPANPVADNAADTFDWTNNPLFTSISDYEYTKNNGAGWTLCTVKPQSGFAGDITTGWVKVRVKANAAAGANEAAGMALASTSAFTVAFVPEPPDPTAPAAPTAGIIDDRTNTFDWTNTPLFTNISDYEYTKNNGAAWTLCTVKPQNGMSGNITAGWVKVRIKANAGGTEAAASVPLSSSSAYTAAPAAPTAPVTDNTTDTFDWTNNPLFTSISNYEYTKNNGAGWTLCTVKPQTGMSGNITAGWVKVRVIANAAGSGEAAGGVLSSAAPYTEAPAAPTAPVSDDKFNTFDWTNAAAFTSLSNYEFSKDNGVTWAICTAKPLTGMAGNITAGWVKVRVAANSWPGAPAGTALASAVAYLAEPAAPTDPIVDNSADTFDWTNTSLFTSVSDYEYSKDNGAAWTLCTVKPQTGMSGNISSGWVKVRVKANAAGTGEAAGAALASNAPYNIAPAAPTAPVSNDKLNTFDWTNTPYFTNVSDYEYSMTNGAAWTLCTTKPVTGLSGNITTGWVKVRIAANASALGLLSGSPLSSAAAYTAAPQAPMLPIVDNAADTFNWTNAPLFANTSDYEYSRDNGSTWTVCTFKPQAGMSGNITIGWVQVRVRANAAGTGEPAGSILSSNAPFNGIPAAPTAPLSNDKFNTFDWTFAASYTAAANYEYSKDNGATWTACTAKPVSGISGSVATGWVKVRTAPNALGFGESAGTALSSLASYTAFPAAPTDSMVDNSADTFDWTYTPLFLSADDYEYTRDNGAAWTVCSVKPQGGMSGNITAGWVKVRIRANAAGSGEAASPALVSVVQYNVTPAAPTVPVSDDKLNTFDWTLTPSYTTAANYEYSKDNGASWTVCASKPVTGISGDVTSGWVKVRTKVNALGFGEPPSAILSSLAPYTAFPAAPTDPVVDNIADTFNWTDNPLYTTVSNYEYTKNNGASWAVCTIKPQSGMSGNITAGWVKVRIKANAVGSGEAASPSLASLTLYNAAPAAPTAAVVNDRLNTFDWTNTPLFTNTSDYEYTKDNGASWAVCTVKPVTGISGNITAGLVQVRIIADARGFGEPASAALGSTSDYTDPPPAPSGPLTVDAMTNTFDWTNVPSYTAVADYEYTSDNGSSWTLCTIKPQNGLWGNITTGWVKVRVKADAGGTGETAGAPLSSTAGYTAP